MINAVNRANKCCQFRHTGSMGSSNTVESDMVELTGDTCLVHYGETPTFIWIASTATRPLPRAPTTAERSVRTESRAPNGLPKPPEPGVTLVAQQRPPAKGAPGEPGWPAAKRAGWNNPLAKAGYCEGMKTQLDELEPRTGANRGLGGRPDGRRDGPRGATVDCNPPHWRARPMAARSSRPPFGGRRRAACVQLSDLGETLREPLE